VERLIAKTERVRRGLHVFIATAVDGRRAHGVVWPVGWRAGDLTIERDSQWLTKPQRAMDKGMT
jgi:hypothetical protein